MIREFRKCEARFSRAARLALSFLQTYDFLIFGSILLFFVKKREVEQTRREAKCKNKTRIKNGS